MNPHGEPVSKFFLFCFPLLNRCHSDPFGFAQDKVKRRIWLRRFMVILGTDASPWAQHNKLGRALFGVIEEFTLHGKVPEVLNRTATHAHQKYMQNFGRVILRQSLPE